MNHVDLISFILKKLILCEFQCNEICVGEISDQAIEFRSFENSWQISLICIAGTPQAENTHYCGKYHCRAVLLFYKFGVICFTTYIYNRCSFGSNPVMINLRPLVQRSFLHRWVFLASGVTKLNIWHGYFTDILHGKYVTVLWVEENFLGISKLKLLNFKLLSNFTLLDDL